jgi:hypothetical protein
LAGKVSLNGGPFTSYQPGTRIGDIDGNFALKAGAFEEVDGQDIQHETSADETAISIVRNPITVGVSTN